MNKWSMITIRKMKNGKEWKMKTWINEQWKNGKLKQWTNEKYKNGELEKWKIEKGKM